MHIINSANLFVWVNDFVLQVIGKIGPIRKRNRVLVKKVQTKKNYFVESGI